MRPQLYFYNSIWIAYVNYEAWKVFKCWDGIAAVLLAESCSDIPVNFKKLTERYCHNHHVFPVSNSINLTKELLIRNYSQKWYVDNKTQCQHKFVYKSQVKPYTLTLQSMASLGIKDSRYKNLVIDTKSPRRSQ